MNNSFINQLFSLKGKTALITGGSSGIGFAMAQSLHLAGAKVILVARRNDQLRDALNRLNNSPEIMTFVADMQSPDDIAALNQFSPDILVHAAGMNLRKAFQETTLEDYDLHQNVHVRALFLMTQIFAPKMKLNQYGRIIAIGSLQSYRAFPNSAPYGAAKGAVLQLTRAIAQEWSADGITANAILPGFFPTNLTRPIFDNSEIVAKNAAQTAIGRNGELEDLHGITVFLASQASSYITGQAIAVDGGFLAK